MSTRFRIGPLWRYALVAGVFVAALVALGSSAYKADRAQAREREFAARIHDVSTSIGALGILAARSDSRISHEQALAATMVRRQVRADIDDAAGIHPEVVEPVIALFERYERYSQATYSRTGAIVTANAADGATLDAIQTDLRRLLPSSAERLRDATSDKRSSRATFLLTMLVGFIALAALVIPARRDARRARAQSAQLAREREAEASFQPIFEQSPLPMLIYEEDGFAIIAVNEAMVSRYGWTRAEFAKMSILDIRPQREVAELTDALANWKPRSGGRQWTHLTATGEEFKVEVHGQRMSFAGKPARVVMIVDVTEREQILSALAESEERHRTIIETAQEGIIVYDLGGNVHIMNERMGEILGLDPDKQVGLSMTEIAGAFGYGDWTPQPRPAQSEVRIERPDGEVRWVLVSSSPWADTEGNPKGVVMMCADLTERRANDERIRDSEALKTAMLDSSIDAIYTVDVDGRILEFNRAAEEIFQIARADAIGRSALELLVPEQHRDAAQPVFAPVTRRGRGRRHSRRVTAWRADRTEFPAEVTVASTEGGRARATIHVRDITVRDGYEQMLKRRALQQSAIADLGAFSLQARTIEAVCEEALTTTARVLGVEFAHLVTFEDGEVGLSTACGWNAPPVFTPSGEAFERFGECLASGPVVSLAATPGGVPRGALHRFGLQSGLFVGVVVDDTLRGSISVHSRDLDAFGPEEQLFVKAVANVVGASLARHEAEQRTRELGLRDILTGLPNRALFQERLSAWGESATRPAAVAFVDVDHFKVLNDALGHEAGDQLLCELAPRFEEALGPGTTVARFGGDEFVVLIEDVEDEVIAKALGERLLGTLTSPVTIQGRLHHVSVSVGLKLMLPGTVDLQSAIRDADSAMYQAKERGRDRVEVFDEVLHQRVVDRLRVDRDMRDALERDDELWCAYQPLVSARTRQVIGVEALARWKHPELGQLAPGEFIPAAEELGLIGALGWHILRGAVHHAAAWVGEGGAMAAAANVSVNLSPQQLADPSLAPRIAVLLDDAGFAPERLTLEVTETTLMADTDAAQRGLEELAALGIRLVLDDFGTGFSSMAYLSKMPVSGIKIDRSFVSSLGESSSAEAIVKAIVSMADALELEVVAEGVETEAQALAVSALGCGKLQGFHFSRPVPEAEIRAIVNSVQDSDSVAA
ncbi:MAG TPA: EAL domain-containing protein [Baekduia sp.]|nr:EAL domain-containing protein [Baekduia sp.]